MSKNKSMAYAVLGIVFVLFNVIAFVVPTAKTPTFWVVYAFIIIAFALQLGVWKFAFKGTDTIKSKFLGISLIYVGFTYLIIQIVAFAIFMIFPLTPTWIAVVVCTLILGISAICLIGTETGREEINRIEEKVEKKVSYIKLLQGEVEMLAESETDAIVKAALTKLAERIRYSDPMSNESLNDIENEIRQKIFDFNNSRDKTTSLEEINHLLSIRNKKCLTLK